MNFNVSRDRKVPAVPEIDALRAAVMDLSTVRIRCGCITVTRKCMRSTSEHGIGVARVQGLGRGCDRDRGRSDDAEGGVEEINK